MRASASVSAPVSVRPSVSFSSRYASNPASEVILGPLRAGYPWCRASSQPQKVKFAPDSALEGTGFEPVWGFFCQACCWFVGGSLFEAGRPFFVPSPTIKFAERAEGVKGPKH